MDLKMLARDFRPVAFCFCAALAQGALFADGVTRIVEPVYNGCRVTLLWEFSGKVESDLILEERFANGWYVADSTVPFGSLDASWLSGRVARFAVKPSLLAQAGSISFVVIPGEGASLGTVAGDWKMYMDGTLRKGGVSGESRLSVLVGMSSGAGAFSGGAGASGAGSSSWAGASGGASASSSSGSSTSSTLRAVVETAIAIKLFKVVDGVIELSYSGVSGAGVMVVEGCKGLGGTWTELKRMDVSAGDGKVTLAVADAGACRFFRLKFLTEEE